MSSKKLTEFAESKVCAKCGIEQPRQNFRPTGKRNPFSLYSYCRECNRKKCYEQYHRNPTTYIKKARKKSDENRDFFRALKDNQPCADCRVRYPYYVLDYDHREPGVKQISCSNVGQKSRGTLLAEIAKCDLVCSNCHRERTHKQRQAKLIATNPARYLDNCRPRPDKFQSAEKKRQREEDKAARIAARQLSTDQTSISLFAK